MVEGTRFRPDSRLGRARRASHDATNDVDEWFIYAYDVVAVGTAQLAHAIGCFRLRHCVEWSPGTGALESWTRCKQEGRFTDLRQVGVAEITRTQAHGGRILGLEASEREPSSRGQDRGPLAPGKER